jgi:TetR/AcrR family transcriptional repressor of lmrAB and yxaGH operons
MPGSRQTRARGESSRRAFVNATAELLRRQGYNATGLNEIVAQAGAPKGSLYFHFPGGKEELAVAAMAQSGDQLRRTIEAIVTSSADLGESLQRLVDALALGLERSSYEAGCPIATITLEAATTSEAVRTTADAVFSSWLAVLDGRLVAAGLLAEDAERRALFVLAAVEGALILARARRDTGPLSAVREELVALVD